MAKFTATIVCLTLLLAASTALAEPRGVEVTVKNVGTAKAEATITREGMTESKNPIKKTVPASGSAVFTKEETAHDPSEIAPIGWQLYIKAPNIPNCRYMISLQNDQCVETEGEGDCALVSECGDCCFHFEIKAQ